DDVWVGVLGRSVLAIRQLPHTTLYKWLGGDAAEAHDMATTLRDYFQLTHPLADLYGVWGAADSRLAQIAAVLCGVRVLRQEPVECLISFICSSNNNISRISLMLDRLRRKYGTHLLTTDSASILEATAADASADSTCTTVDGESNGSLADADGPQQLDFFSFPSLEQLAEASEKELRDLATRIMAAPPASSAPRTSGYGYRAGYIVASVAYLNAREGGGEAWLLALRSLTGSDSDTVVRAELCQLKGVGPKVADCIALFALDQSGAIPVDVHVWRIACRDYDASLRLAKSLTPTIYQRVGELFKQRFGQHAGWAHSLLFAGGKCNRRTHYVMNALPAFQVLLPDALRAEMKAFKAQEKEWKDAAKLVKTAARATTAINVDDTHIEAGKGITSANGKKAPRSTSKRTLQSLPTMAGAALLRKAGAAGAGEQPAAAKAAQAGRRRVKSVKAADNVAGLSASACDAVPEAPTATTTGANTINAGPAKKVSIKRKRGRNAIDATTGDISTAGTAIQV
ncbi:DNA glycosylase, partial [Tribonema minus]